MSDEPLGEKIAEAVELLESHDDAEYEALEPQAKANYQEALEFLLRLESSVDGDASAPVPDGGSTEIAGIDCELVSTMGRDEALAGRFDPGEMVIYDPEESVVDDRWISMAYDATVPLENMC